MSLQSLKEFIPVSIALIDLFMGTAGQVKQALTALKEAK